MHSFNICQPHTSLVLLPNSYDIEKRNFENLCYMHRTNLKRIIRGEDPYKILTDNERNKLRDIGILQYTNKHLSVTDKAKYELSKNSTE